MHFELLQKTVKTGNQKIIFRILFTKTMHYLHVTCRLLKFTNGVKNHQADVIAKIKPKTIIFP